MIAPKKILEYVRTTTWYRGQPKGYLATKWRRLHFTSKRYEAVSYAKARDGEILKVKVSPKKLFLGSLPDLARSLGVIKQYYALEIQDRFRESEALVENLAKKHGYDASIVAKDQLVVYDPKAMTVLDIQQVSVTKEPVVKARKLITKRKRRTSRRQPAPQLSTSGVRV